MYVYYGGGGIGEDVLADVIWYATRMASYKFNM